MDATKSRRKSIKVSPADLRIIFLVLLVVILFVSYFVLTCPLYILVVATYCGYKLYLWRYGSDSSKASLLDDQTGSISACIVGAGFSGLCMGIKLKAAGIPFRIIEKSSCVGGTWWDNRYPGCACDVWSTLYQFSFFQNPFWSCFVAPADEIREYLHKTAKHYQLYDHISFNTSVNKAIWNDDLKSWRIETSNEDEIILATHIVSACGVLRKPNFPNIPGLELFQGEHLHSQQMSPDVAHVKGRRVAVIGSAASAVQICPAIVDHVKELRVFQRTPNWIFPKQNPKIPNWVQFLFARVPYFASIFRACLFLCFELNGILILTKGPMTKLFRMLLAKHYEIELKGNKTLLQKLTPDYDVGCKRLLLANDFLSMFVEKKNAHLITEQIERIDEKVQ